jgi:DNA polymerase III subunit chi
MVARAEFFILDGSDQRARWRFACQEIEKAITAEERVLVWFDSDAELAAFDELLWTFADRSFVPHEPLGPESSWEETPVLLSAARLPAAAAQLIVNLAAGLPGGIDQALRIVEIIDSDPARRQAGRARFKQYRERGIESVTHQNPVAGP